MHQVVPSLPLALHYSLTIGNAKAALSPKQKIDLFYEKHQLKGISLSKPQSNVECLRPCIRPYLLISLSLMEV